MSVLLDCLKARWRSRDGWPSSYADVMKRQDANCAWFIASQSVLASNAAIYLIYRALAIPVLLKTVCLAFRQWHILVAAVSSLLLCLSDYNAIRRLIFFSEKKINSWRYSRRNMRTVRKQYSTIMIALHCVNIGPALIVVCAGLLTRTPILSAKNWINGSYLILIEHARTRPRTISRWAWICVWAEDEKWRRELRRE